MTIDTDLSKRIYTGNGVKVDYDYDFKIPLQSDLLVSLFDPDGVEYVQVLDTDYEVTGAGSDSGGQVIFLSGAPANGWTVLLLSNVGFTQPTDFKNQGRFFPETHENAFDRNAILSRQNLERFGRTFQVGAEIDGFDGLLRPVVPLAPLVISANGKGIEAGDLNMSGDLLLRGNLADDTGSSLVGFVQSGSGSVARDTLAKMRERLSVLDKIPVALHADIEARTSVTDVAGYINQALVQASSEGRDVYVPRGKYYLASGIVLDDGSDTDDYAPRAALIGDGASNTIFSFANGNINGITIQGGTGGGTHLNMRSGGFGLEKADRLGVGILMDNCAYAAIRDIQATGWNIGIRASDCLTSEFSRVTLRNNDYGFQGEYVNGSFPNALSFFACELGINRIAAMRILGGGSITMYGGAVEGNGWIGGGAGYGVYIEDAGAESAVGLAIHGTYFEANEGVADVWIKNNVARSSAHDLTGATFNRVGNVSFVTNNIRVENLSTGEIKLSLSGCGFKGFGAYTPNAGRQYITAINTGGGVVRINRLAGNYYQSATENAEMSGISDSEASIPIMWGRFSIGAGVVNKVATKNVGVATYNGAGDYTINLEQGVTGAAYAVFPGQNHSAFCNVQAFKASDTAITVNVWNAAGVKFDPAGFSLQVYALRQ